MDMTLARRERLCRFVDLARVYRGWSRQQMAANLGRDLSKVVPDSGNPKLDLVVALADALDWNVGDVARTVWEEPRPLVQGDEDFATLDGHALDAHRAGDWERLVEVGSRMVALASTPVDRARALNRVSGGHDGMGRFVRSLDCLREAVGMRGLPPAIDLMLRVNLAGAHYALWHLVEARATANELVERFESAPPDGRLERVAQAFALMYRGQCGRRGIEDAGSAAKRHAKAAQADLALAGTLFGGLAREFGDDSYGGVGNTCRGALIEAECALGTRDPRDAVALIVQSLGGVEDPQLAPPGDWLESYGWWCIYGCNIALRHTRGADLDRAMAVFTNKAVEIAERLGNWSLRERAFSMELVRRDRQGQATGFGEDWVLDEDEVRTIAGTMGRFPSFRETGWRILSQAKIVGAQ
ncbi:MAG: hypothetical protein FJ260_06325 [Planctomycetes bacterium]|nr:hypothetical protein [Planctomycetota bacterium]